MNSMNSVLIVDDSVENLNSLRSILENDYKIFVATSGESALKIMNRTIPDLVLLDVIMPGMSGFDVFNEMKKHEDLKAIPVIFVTGDNDIEGETKGVLAGAMDYIHKPYNAEVVYLKVRNHMIGKITRDNLEYLVKMRTAELSASRQAVIIGMSMLAEGRDHDTGNHLKRMQQYTKILAQYIAKVRPDLLSVSEAEETVLYAPLHDIGKVSIPDSILLKKGRLTDEEFTVMQNHTVFGAEVLVKTDIFMSIDERDIENSAELDLEFQKNYVKMSSKLLANTEFLSKIDIAVPTKNESAKPLRVAIEICESHHEKYDGTGYPQKLKGEEIPISARIVALADIYDALTSSRPYKKAFTHEEAYDIIVNGDGRTEPAHFAPEVLDAFINTSSKFEALVQRLAD